MGLSHAHAEQIADEDFTATFSHYNKLEEMLTCQPGYRGGFATPDTLFLKPSAIATGAPDLGDFVSFSYLGMDNDPPRQTGPRPYAEGCQLAIDQFKVTIAAKEVIEVPVRRAVYKSGGTLYRPRRNVAGITDGFNQVNMETVNEIYTTTVGGFEFTAHVSAHLKKL